jgi:hypothetical protein
MLPTVIRRVGWLVLATGALVPTLVAAEVEDKDAWCDESYHRNDGRALFCEVREFTLPARARLSLDGGTNGGVKVESWNRKDILIQAKVEVWARTQDNAEEVGREIQVSTAGGHVVASGPEQGWFGRKPARTRSDRRIGWGVSYRVHVPRTTDLEIETYNGGISVAGVRGHLELQALNGGLALSEVGGRVHGRTTNGALAVTLDGDRWQGEGLDLQTTNGSIALRIPARYSAALETGTTNGRMNVDDAFAAGYPSGRSFDLVRNARRHTRLRVELGRGGAPIRAVTTNGSVKVARAR